MTSKRALAAGAGLAAAALVAAGCSNDAAGATSGNVRLSLVAYSTPQAAYEKIIKAFEQTPAGRHVTFTQSYGASGDQSRAVASGLSADVVAFSLAPDVTRLVDAQLVSPSWAANTHHGMVTDSVVVIATRKGNPKHVRDWSDLTRKGVKVITPNPFTSGGARWNVMAAYGAASHVGKDAAAGKAYLGKLFRNVPVQDDSARKSLQTFAGGEGDALISYENDAIFAQQHGQALDYVVPRDTILIQNPVAVTTDSTHPEQAKAFVNFLYTKAAQRIFADNGYRPVVPGIAKPDQFPKPAGLFTINQLGGWTKVTDTFFDPTKGVTAGIEKQVGVGVDQ